MTQEATLRDNMYALFDNTECDCIITSVSIPNALWPLSSVLELLDGSIFSINAHRQSILLNTWNQYWPMHSGGVQKMMTRSAEDEEVMRMICLFVPFPE
jgi:hypothetical protein